MKVTSVAHFANHFGTYVLVGDSCNFKFVCHIGIANHINLFVETRPEA
jgi:hypothetical protein